MQGEKLFLSVESQHLNVERIMELENCHLIVILVIVDLRKNHQRILKWKFAEEQDIYVSRSVYPQDAFYKVKSNNFTMKKAGRHPYPTSRASWSDVQRGARLHFYCILVKNAKPESNHKATWEKSILRDVLQSKGASTLLKKSVFGKLKTHRGAPLGHRRLRHDNKVRPVTFFDNKRNYLGNWQKLNRL